MAEAIVGGLVFVVLSIVGMLGWYWYEESNGMSPIGRRNAVVDNPSAEESRRDIAISVSIVGACVVATLAVAVLVAWLLR